MNIEGHKRFKFFVLLMPYPACSVSSTMFFFLSFFCPSPPAELCAFEIYTQSLSNFLQVHSLRNLSSQQKKTLLRMIKDFLFFRATKTHGGLQPTSHSVFSISD